MKFSCIFLLFIAFSCLANNVDSNDFLKKSSPGVSDNIQEILTFDTLSTFPSISGNNNFYVKVSSISFYDGTTGGVCSGTERTLDLSSNTYMQTSGIIDGDGHTLTTLNLNTGAIDAAATALGYTLADGGCVKIGLAYKNGNASGTVSTTVLQSGVADYELSGIFVGGGIITSGTSVNATQTFSLHSYLVPSAIHLRLTQETGSTITMTNQGYSDTGAITSAILPASMADDFEDNCNSALPIATGNTCTAVYNGSTAFGDGFLSIADTDALDPTGTSIVPFTIQAPGKVTCWGRNDKGQIGNGAAGDNVPTPTQVLTLTSGVISVVGNGYHTCALLNTGSMKCWGDNLFGEVGNTSSSQFNTPAQVTNLTSGVSSIAASRYSSCAISQ